MNALGAIVAPFYGIIVVDYYLIKRQHLNMQELFSSAPGGAYYYVNGWNTRALLAFGGAALFSLSTVIVPALRGRSACLSNATGSSPVAFFLLAAIELCTIVSMRQKSAASPAHFLPLRPWTATLR